MNFTTQLNPSTKCREVFSVDEATGASAKIAVIPAGVDPFYADLIETACSVSAGMPRQTVLDKIRGVHAPQ